ncbi:PTS sugar transporter subunit IIA [Teichococcus oryzae]|jgi:PTS system nitrogen regulatory IIA component|uniref:PTS sugar transporter subunit IIA n=1 Tax=Teichococcus oryzae TaxID=1608942 RepID=A0A5B2TCA3_9PROT|nr:PTS sugar transporter subunit IIA [Pseudoroseomonas oryzae]KAA2212132.1 PTS sugar transporter subunit IIA [Pseudoroseomonas oryzae]
MALADLFPREEGVLRLHPADKAELLEMLATEAAERLNHPGKDILEALQGREKLGSTALGRGIALPHARMAGLEQPLAILARLETPIEFEARDGERVDLVFLVLWPEETSEGFLPALSDICRSLRGSQLPRRLRKAASASEALALLQGANQDNDEPEEF